MSFQNYPQTFAMQYPYRGINVNADNNPIYARYIQNMLTGDNKAGKIRYGTILASAFAFDAARTYRDTIEVMSFLKNNGDAEIITYTQYIYKVPNLDVATHVAVAQNVTNTAYCTVTIDISSYTANQKAYFKKIFFDGVYVFIKQNISQGTEVLNYAENGDILTFDLPFADTTFEDPYELWIERAGIYRVKTDSTFEMIQDDLDPGVIISHINYLGKLLIANGVDEVKVYDGQNIVSLRGDVSAPISGNITVNALTLQFNIADTVLAELQDNIVVGTVLTLTSPAEVKNVTVTNIVFAAPNNNLIAVTITTNIAPQANVTRIGYTKPCPAFSFLCVAHDRLWALAPGRAYKDKFRPPELSMRVYYADKVASIEGWFNERTNDLLSIDTSLKSEIPDNLEAIKLFQGRLWFIGRETTQIWNGTDPTTKDDGQNLKLADFEWFITEKVGVKQSKLVIEIPGYLIMVSSNGIVAITSNNITQQPNISNAESDPVNNLVNNQLAFIDTDREHRNMRAFVYPYGRFIGFKVKYSCLIYQIITEGAWSIFSENFADANSFFYDSTKRNLYLGLPGGKIVTYADKIKNQSYEEYGKGKISWSIDYNWLYPGNTWTNIRLFIAAQSLKKMTINVRVFLERDESRSIKNEEIVLLQQGVLYDVSLYDTRIYSRNQSKYSHETIKFTADCFMLQMSGLANDSYIFDRAVLAGGTNEPSKEGRNAN